MYIEKIEISNYRNFDHFEMSFHKGLNVIVGANNSGKTGLLKAINLLSGQESISVHDFNKNNLKKHYQKKYLEEAPFIEIIYHIMHEAPIDDTNDESSLKLQGLLNFNTAEKDSKNPAKFYHLRARLRARYNIKSEAIERYREAVKGVVDLESYIRILDSFVSDGKYAWNYSAADTGTKISNSVVKDIFEICFIGADRTHKEIDEATKKEIGKLEKDDETISMEIIKLKEQTSQELKNILSGPIENTVADYGKEGRKIGLEKGKVSVQPTVAVEFSLANTYFTEAKDTKADYTMPIDHNGSGYNNLINILILVRLSKLEKGKEFHLMCLEEPEAHLHPAMQYKLFKYLKEMENKDELNQQIFVTTHSSNISSVAGLDNIFMLAYERNDNNDDCISQSLSELFGKPKKKNAKKHLAKFLDVTRSDMLFADKVILMEGIAERLLLPHFMEICGCPYEDDHISIVEIGGRHFEHFLELFKNNKVQKKVLCITDKDFAWQDADAIGTKNDYDSFKPDHVKKLENDYKGSCFNICTQSLGGRTFEDELFLANINNKNLAKKLLKMAIPKSMHGFVNTNGLRFEDWEKADLEGKDKNVAPTFKRYMDQCRERISKDPANEAFYKQYFFAEIFLHYVERRGKGDTALSILTDEIKGLKVPPYINEGIKWL